MKSYGQLQVENLSARIAQLSIEVSGKDAMLQIQAEEIRQKDERIKELEDVVKSSKEVVDKLGEG